MKIGIVTQPLHTNYGGLLQAYALQTVLKRMGHEAWMIRFCRMERFQGFNTAKRRLRKAIVTPVKWLLRRPIGYLMTEEEEEYISRRTEKFIQKHIVPITSVVRSGQQLAGICNGAEGFEAYVVGSDQVWRPMYSPYIPHFFLDFTEHQSVKRVAYAASFGVSDWEYSASEEKVCGALAKKFDAISVREDSGVTLCREHFTVAARHVLDPTMLLEKEDYETIVLEEGEPVSSGNLFCYLLDESDTNRQHIETVADMLRLTPFQTMPKCRATKQNLKNDIDECVFPSVTAWLRSFMDAEYVLTDSFHGCVFSIIFNKPFVAFGNKGRGQARFHSLLRMFGLENRLYDGTSSLTELVKTPIDWDAVNGCRKDWQEKSKEFLFHSLQGK